jgi:hypothetical protein
MDLLRKRWLSDVLIVRRAREVSGSSDGAKIAQLVQFHGLCARPGAAIL